MCIRSLLHSVFVHCFTLVIHLFTIPRYLIDVTIMDICLQKSIYPTYENENDSIQFLYSEFGAYLKKSTLVFFFHLHVHVQVVFNNDDVGDTFSNQRQC